MWRPPLNSTKEATVQINVDMSERVVIDSHGLPWVPSPMPGVERRMLSRDGEENGAATSIVRYAPGSRFPAHGHPLGEEILVLEGTFSDEFGEYPAGSYLKNPAGSRHSPASDSGCTLFVKLGHLALDDRHRVVVLPSRHRWQQGAVPGLRVLGLDSFGTSHTALVRWSPGTVFQRHRHFGGEEILVIEGVFQDEHQRYPAGTWIRSPHMSVHEPLSPDGCLILVKTGHLMDSTSSNR